MADETSNCNNMVLNCIRGRLFGRLQVFTGLENGDYAGNTHQANAGDRGVVDDNVLSLLAFLL